MAKASSRARAARPARRRRAETAGYGFLTVGQTARILGVSIYMVSGTLEIGLDELQCFVLQAGDSFWFESMHGHRWFNPGDTEAALLWINTPPTF